MKFGNDNNYWIQNEEVMDISRGANANFTCKTTTLKLKFNPKKAAIVIIDMQNFFLSEKLERDPLTKRIYEPIINTVKKGRDAGMKIIWLNWGVNKEISNIPPSVLRTFQRSEIYTGFGNELPHNLGPLLTKGSWSAELVPELESIRLEDDLLIHKYRTSGFFDTPLDGILRNLGINSLFFAGVNTDQCVKGTLDDANCLGYDCILLSDCTATSSPGGYENVIYNVERFGFVTNSIDIQNMEENVLENTFR